ncbi:M56 family metallopeptidase [Shewanella colwelliana]|uniref:M56 family metallopeptidase n=1 Tax=Shewanella colwelliana TaxID=23 RepID=UPI00299EDEA9|nr:M56 family metallopeptidase [Shewanella colwelliana]MDX1282883.1 M56 family metallopeptidase [Shewanella colwelliana]
MLSYLLELALLPSLLCAIFLLSHSVLLNRIGAHNTYAMWIGIPLLLLGSVLGKHIPQLISAEPLTVLQHYKVIASDAIGQTSTLLSSEILVTIWGLGSAALISLLFSQATSLRRLVANSHIIALPDVEASIRVKTHIDIHSPMLVGLINPVILVPHSFKQLQPAQQQAIVDHEQFHHRRYDILANLFAYLLVTLFWFNPLSWLAYRRFRDDQELACDAQVTQTMTTPEKIAYSQTLLAYSQQAQMGMLHTHYGNKTILKERIMQMKKQHGKSTLAILGLTMALGLSGALINQTANAGDKHTLAQQKDGVHPVMRIEPRYPIKAAQDGVEGYVQLQFDISKKGKVSKVSVIKSSPTGVFDAEAIKALEQWTYKPSAKGMQDAQVQLDFMLAPPKAEIERVMVTAEKY